MRAKLHQDQVGTSVALVKRLIAEQLPEWAHLAVVPVDSYGTDHDIYRLGNELAVRLPIIGWATEQASMERRWLPELAPRLPLAVPEQIALGRPGHGFPFRWSICRWLPGVDASHRLDNYEVAASDLAGFVEALRRIEKSRAPDRRPGGRGGPLLQFDGDVRRSVVELGNRIDAGTVLRCWDQALEVGPWTGDDVWIHGDLLPGNLLTVDGRLSAVIDFGCLNIGDPACDLQPAWNMFMGVSRRRFLDQLDVDAASWLRGRGWVVFQTVMALAYYWDSSAAIVRQASYALDQAVIDRF